MRVLAGTSGFGYAAWAGRFYPPALPATARLPYYASRLEAVEVNATFRRMPTPAMLARWAAAVPGGFVFALKAPQQITHVRRLRGAGEAIERLDAAAAALGPHRGPILYQLPPTLRADLPLLHDFLDALPPGPAAFEFRHASWLDDRVFDGLAQAGAALCVADTDETSTPFVPTGPFGYLRLRRRSYSDRDLALWLERVSTTPWATAYVFFKHEDEALGPALALRLRALADTEPAGRDVPGPPP